MAGYIFAVSKEGWEDFCNENLLHGFFCPYTPEVTEEYLEVSNKRKRQSLNKVMASVYAELITMKPGDNIYFLSQRKIFGVGKLVCLGDDCKYDNYLDASALLPDCSIDMEDVLTTRSSRARWVFFFEPSPYFFRKGADMDDVLKYRPDAFKMLRAFEGVTFIKIDDDENRALKEYISLINEPSYDNITENSFSFSPEKHTALTERDIASHKMDIQKALLNDDNKEYVLSEMFIEASLLHYIAYDDNPVTGHWDYVSHQLIASPFKPLKYIDKIDVYGYRYSSHYTDSPQLITKFLIIEIKKGKVNKATLKQVMQYVDWICAEYASGDYSRIEAYVVGESSVRNLDDLITEYCQRDFIIETHPVRTEKWNSMKFIKFTNNNRIEFE